MRNAIFAATVALVGMVTSLSPAMAEETCQLKRIAAIPFQTDSTAHVYVPVVLNGRNTHLMLDTGAFGAASVRKWPPLLACPLDRRPTST